MRNRRIIRILAIVLVVLLVGGVVVSALLSALAESPASQAQQRDRYELTMEYIEDEQALRIGQRLVFINRTGDHLDRVVFYATANMFRRESALMYESDDLDAVFPMGYAPGGIELSDVRVDGAAADYGFSGEDELVLRVGCDVPSGGSCVFEFDYYLLLTDCNAFIGVGETDVRLSAFYFIPGIYDKTYREFILNKPLPFTRWLYSEAGDYEVSLTLPGQYRIASVGSVERMNDQDGRATWRITAENVRELALSFGKRWRESTVETESGLSIRVMSGLRAPKYIGRIAAAAVDRCADWFGGLPGGLEELVIATSDYPLDAKSYMGYILMPSRLLDPREKEELTRQLRFCVAQQYFGLSAYVEPSADAWLSDSVSEYLSYLMLEAEDGHDAFLVAANRDWVSALQLTVPGGLRITSDASRFKGDEFDIIVRRRGAVVFHELRQAMGLEGLLEGLRRFYEFGQDGRTLTEMDLVDCMDAATGRSWEDFLTDWVFNVGDYVNQNIDWFE